VARKNETRFPQIQQCMTDKNHHDKKTFYGITLFHFQIVRIKPVPLELDSKEQNNKCQQIKRRHTLIQLFTTTHACQLTLLFLTFAGLPEMIALLSTKGLVTTLSVPITEFSLIETPLLIITLRPIQQASRYKHLCHD
jgi:hypothetical protein